MAEAEATAKLDLDPAVDDPAFFTSGAAIEVCRELRRTDPFHWYDKLGAWLVTRYEDIRQISQSPELFSSEPALAINDIKYDRSWSRKFWPEGADNLIMTDPPKHKELRRIINTAFTRQRIASLGPSIRELARELIDLLPVDEPVDVVAALSTPLPLLVVCQLMGWPSEAWEQLGEWSDLNTLLSEDPNEETVLAAIGELQNLFGFLGQTIEARRDHPDDDLTSTLIAGTVDGARLSDINLVLFSQLLLTAGNETNRNLISGGVAALANHPDQLARLAADPSNLPTAVEEMLRFVSPINQFLRVAKKDLDFAGHRVKAGDPLVLLYISGNRDESIWEVPDKFDAARLPRPGHIAFGWGEHVCPGASLARLTTTICFEELFKRFSGWELTGPVERRASTTINSIETLPLRFLPRR